MGWPTPKFSKSQVNRAGEILTSALRSKGISKYFGVDKWLWSFDVLSNWRACHGYPTNTFQATLRQKLKKIDPDALVAQRLKRMPSILKKLQRFPGMNLSRMQDIGGLRAVVGSMDQLEILYQNYKGSRFTHSLISEYDYINNPKESGY
jgi:putative GTP pyrophosphokinase